MRDKEITPPIVSWYTIGRVNNDPGTRNGSSPLTTILSSSCAFVIKIGFAERAASPKNELLSGNSAYLKLVSTCSC